MSTTVSSILDGLSANEAEGSQWDTSSRDEALLRRYAEANDQQAFEALYCRYRGRLHRFVTRLTRDAHEAEEVFQDTWMAVIRGRERYEPNVRFAAYLFAIAHRRLVDRWRRSKRWRDVLLTAESALSHADGESHDNGDRIEDVADQSAVLPEDWAQHAQFHQALLEELERLPVLQREVFLMKAEADLSMEEIGCIMGASHEATRSRFRYATARLRKALRSWK